MEDVPVPDGELNMKRLTELFRDAPEAEATNIVTALFCILRATRTSKYVLQRELLQQGNYKYVLHRRRRAGAEGDAETEAEGDAETEAEGDAETEADVVGDLPALEPEGAWGDAWLGNADELPNIGVEDRPRAEAEDPPRAEDRQRAEAEDPPRAEDRRAEAEDPLRAEDRQRAEAEDRQRAEAEDRPRAEAEDRPRAEAEDPPRAEAEDRPRAEAEDRPRADAEDPPLAEAAAEDRPRAEAAAVDPPRRRRFRIPAVQSRRWGFYERPKRNEEREESYSKSEVRKALTMAMKFVDCMLHDLPGERYGIRALQEIAGRQADGSTFETAIRILSGVKIPPFEIRSSEDRFYFFYNRGGLDIGVIDNDLAAACPEWMML